MLGMPKMVVIPASFSACTIASDVRGILAPLRWSKR
jgi:hypothetical protein